MSAQHQPAPCPTAALPTKLAAGGQGAGGNRPRARRQNFVGGNVATIPIADGHLPDAMSQRDLS